MEKASEKLKREIQEEEKEIEEINRKIKNNDYNQLKEVHHDKMVLENRRMILQNKILLWQLFEEFFKDGKNDSENLKQQNKILNKNNSDLIEIIKEIYKNKEMSPELKEKINNSKE